jgi:hypothetical protein
MFFHASASPGRGSGTTTTGGNGLAPLRVHHGRLGRLGEQRRLARLALERRRRAAFGAVSCFVPSLHDELLIHTLRFMYGRPALRLGDVAWLLTVLGAGAVDWAATLRTARGTGLLHGLSCLLDYADQIHQAVVRRPLLESAVRRRLAAPGGWGTVEWRDGAFAYPSAHVTRRLLLRHVVDELLAGSLGSAGRLALMPVVGARQRRRRETHARRAAAS